MLTREWKEGSQVPWAGVCEPTGVGAGARQWVKVGHKCGVHACASVALHPQPCQTGRVLCSNPG